MSETRIITIIIYIAVVIVAFFLKKAVFRLANKAIIDKKLSTGVYRLFPVEREKSVQLAKSYKTAIKILFWFIVFIFPFMFIMSVKIGAL